MTDEQKQQPGDTVGDILDGFSDAVPGKAKPFVKLAGLLARLGQKISNTIANKRKK